MTATDPSGTPPTRTSTTPWRQALRRLTLPRAHGEAAYRPDIDGLRAVAVLSVLLYHLNVPLMSGGYVGVDIFFVISGFLITRNIWTELESRTFSIRAFYLRRIRRIAPAFIVMAAVTLVVGSLLLLPDDLSRLGASTASAAVSASNIFFAVNLDTGYFADTSEQEPMLHTWSLGVEEQFYLLWPAALVVLMLLVARLGAGGRLRVSARRWAVAGTAIVLVVSYVFAEWVLGPHPKVAYFLLPARAGELMTGALLAFTFRRESDVELLATRLGVGLTRLVAEAAGLAGFALIAWSLTQLDDTSSFPGLNAVPSTLGAMLVIFAGSLRSSLVYRVLGWPPMVFVGLISYSLYLWHWPVLAFARYFYPTLSIAQLTVLVPVIFACAIVSYRWVELPARRWRPPPRRQVLRLFAIPTSALLVGSLTIVGTDGLKAVIAGSPLFDANLASLTSSTQSPLAYDYNCQLSQPDTGILTDPHCLLGATTAIDAGPIDVLVWGDSHAAASIGLLGSLAQGAGTAFRNASFSTCPPLFGGQWGTAQFRAGCTMFRELVRNAFASGAFKAVVMGAAWASYDLSPKFRTTLEDTIRTLTGEGVRVILLGEVPVFDAYQRQCEARALRFPVDCSALARQPDTGEPAADQFVRDLASRVPDVFYLSVRGLLCNAGVCSPYVDGSAVYYNASHLSMDGSWRLGAMIGASPDGPVWVRAIWGAAAP